MQADSRYTKANVTPQAAHVLKILAAEQNKYIYQVVDDILGANFPDYFQKGKGC